MNLLLVEDDSTLGETMKERLLREGYEVDWVSDCSAAEKLVSEKIYSLVIIDVGLPDGSGFDLAQRIKSKTQTPFLFVTAQSAAEDRLKGYEIGAEEFIPKPFHLREFLLRVKHVLNNHVLHQKLQLGFVEVDWNAMSIKNSTGLHLLTRREFAVLKILYERSPKVVSRDDLLDAAWGENEYPSHRTVDNIIVKLRNLLEDQSQKIQSIRGIGYKWTDV